MKLNDFTKRLLGYSAERDECIAGPGRWEKAPPLVVDTPLLREMQGLADELSSGGSRPIWYFLVGGPGNGKSEAVGAFVRRANENAAKESRPPVVDLQNGKDGGSIPYWFVGKLASGSLTLLQDISVPRHAGSDPADDLLSILEMSLADGAHVVACANRGMLLRATRRARKLSADAPLVRILETIDKGSQEGAAVQDSRSIVTFEDTEIDLRVWPLDHESVLFGEATSNPWKESVGSVVDQIIVRAAAAENWEQNGCSECRAAQLCPMLADARWLRDEARRQATLKILRNAEVLAGQRIVLREALGLVSLILVGSPADFGTLHPCEWVLGRIDPDHPDRARDVLALLELITHRIYQDLFARTSPAGVAIDRQHDQRDSWVLEKLTLLGGSGKEVSQALKKTDASFSKQAGPQRLIGDAGILSILDPSRDTSWCNEHSVVADGQISDLRTICYTDQSGLEQQLGDLFQALEDEALQVAPHTGPAQIFAAIYRWASTFYLRLAGTATGSSGIDQVVHWYLSLLPNPVAPIGPQNAATTLRDVIQASATGSAFELAPSFEADLPTLRLQPERARARSERPRWPANDRLTLRVSLPGFPAGPTLIVTAATFVQAWRKQILGAADWDIPPAVGELMHRWRQDFAVTNEAFRNLQVLRFKGKQPLEFELVSPGEIHVRRA